MPGGCADVLNYLFLKKAELMSLSPISSKILLTALFPIYSLILQGQSLSQYENLVAIGDYAMEVSDYEEAISAYSKALELFPDRHSTSQKLKNAKRRFEESRSSSFDQLVSLGDSLFKEQEYILSRKAYLRASQIRDDQYPRKRIEKIDSIVPQEALVQSEDRYHRSLSEIYNEVKRAVFYIYTMDYSQRVMQGSGFFIAGNGIGVSNYHVFKNALEGLYLIKMYDDQIYEIEEILYEERSKDIIVFRVKKPNESFVFPFLTISNRIPEIGEDVFAVGNPRGFGFTLSTGIVSGHRDIYIQTNTDITYGSSGGPLFNVTGEVVGITTLGIAEGNLNFAVKAREIPMVYWWKGND